MTHSIETPRRFYGNDISEIGEMLCELTLLADGTYEADFIFVATDSEPGGSGENA